MFIVAVLFTILYFFPSSSESGPIIDVVIKSDNAMKKEVLINIRNDPREVENDFNEIENENQVLEEPADVQIDEHLNNINLKHVLARPNTGVQFQGIQSLPTDFIK